MKKHANILRMEAVGVCPKRVFRERSQRVLIENNMRLERQPRPLARFKKIEVSALG